MGITFPAVAYVFSFDVHVTALSVKVSIKRIYKLVERETGLVMEDAAQSGKF
jgi:hypothetical protein